MKNTKLTKILVMALSLALLIGSAIAFAVSAADDDTYAIKSINISHEDSTKVLVAVDALGVDPATIEVKYTIGAGEEKTAKYYGLVDIYKDGNQYPVFYTEGIPAKDMGEDVVAEAHKAGTTPAAPEYKDISVATYLYTKLYREGYAAETTGEAAEKRALYESMLVYGANAQEVLWNNKNPGNERTLVTDYIAVYAEDGSINGKGSFVILKSAGTVTITYAGTQNADFVQGWNITTYANGNATTTYKTDSTIALTKSAILTPDLVPAQDFEGTYTDAPGGTNSNTLTFADGMTAGGGKNYTPEADGLKAGAEVVTDANGNKYLRLTSASRTVDSTNRGPGFNPVTTTLTNDANVIVLSFDFMYEAGKFPANGMQVIFRGVKGGYAQLNAAQAFTISSIAPNPDTWYNIRFEYYAAEKVVQVYSNGIHIKNVTAPNQGTAFDAFGEAKSVDVGFYNDGPVDAGFDNVAAYKTTKTYVEYPVATPKLYDFEGEYTATEITTADGNTTTNIDFGNVNANFDGAKQNTTGESDASVVTLADGNKALNVFTPGRVNPDGTSNDNNRSHTINFYTENVVSASLANATVIEFSMYVNNIIPEGSAAKSVASSNFLQLTFRDAASKYIGWNMNMTDVIKYAGVEIGAPNQWINLKLIFKGDEHKAEIYVDDTYTGDLVWSTKYTASNTDEDALFNSLGATVNEFNIGTYNAGGMIDLTIDNVRAYNTYIAPSAE